MATLTETQNQEKIIELLTDIKGVLEEIRDQENNEDEETYTCDNCDEEATGEPAKSINKFTFCSSECYEEWSDSEN